MSGKQRALSEAKSLAAAKASLYPLEVISTAGVACPPICKGASDERHVTVEALEALVLSAGIAPVDGGFRTALSRAVYDAEIVRRSFQHGETVAQVLLERAEQAAEALAASTGGPSTLKVAEASTDALTDATIRVCVVCDEPFVVPYYQSGHLSKRKTCGESCGTALLSRNAKASRGNDWNTSIVPSQKVLAGE